MKQSLSLSLLMLVLLFALPPPCHGKGEQGTVTGDGVRVRSGPGTQFKVLGSLNKGATVTVYETKGEWKRIKTSKGLTGWMHGEYLSIGPGEGFDEFFEHFHAAVKTRNKAALRRMLAPDFRYTFGEADGKDPIGAAFRMWDEMKAWPEIEKAMAKGTLRRVADLGEEYISPPEFETTPEYYGWRAIFRQEKGRWRCVVLVCGD